MTEPGMDLQQEDWESAFNVVFAQQAPVEPQQSPLAAQPAAETPLNPAPQPGESSPQDLYNDARWKPMLTLFGYGIASQFLWAVTTGEIQTYEHRETLRFLHIDSVTGECLNQSCEVISSESALHHAFQARTPSIAPAIEVIPSHTPPAPALYAEASPAESAEPMLNSFLRTSDDGTPEDVEETGAPNPGAPYATVLENLQGLLKPAMRIRLRNLLRTNSTPSRKIQRTTNEPGPSELDFASFTRRHSAL